MSRGPEFGVRSEFGVWSDVSPCFPLETHPRMRLMMIFYIRIKKTKVRGKNVKEWWGMTRVNEEGQRYEGTCR